MRTLAAAAHTPPFPSFRNVPGVALYYYTLTNLRQSLVKLNPPPASGLSTTTSSRPKLPFIQDLFAGATSRVAVGFLLMPFTVLKTRAESSLYQHQGLLASFRSVLAQPGGFRGLFTGVSLLLIFPFVLVDPVIHPLIYLFLQFWVTSLRDAPNAGLFVVFYERTRHLLQRSPALPPAAVDSLSALLGASAATLATSPFDMIKTQRCVSYELAFHSRALLLFSVRLTDRTFPSTDSCGRWSILQP